MKYALIAMEVTDTSVVPIEIIFNWKNTEFRMVTEIKMKLKWCQLFHFQLIPYVSSVIFSSSKRISTLIYMIDII